MPVTPSIKYGMGFVPEFPIYFSKPSGMLFLKRKRERLRASNSLMHFTGLGFVPEFPIYFSKPSGMLF